MYNLAKKYGHVTKIRTRIINAPQMERANIRILGTENFYYPPPKVQLCTDLNVKMFNSYIQKFKIMVFINNSEFN